MELLLISGSASKKAHTTALLEYIAKLAQDKGVETAIWKLADRPLPTSHPQWHYDPQNVDEPTVREFARAIADADHLVIGTPLYHGS
ncbi:NAD(P)H-dependent oxidoreductase, partial [Candidatus Saccharibacteria bacterium]|nr:NAD(P)H-dependent oxidoreductase [Candidatus Saccharibacteria bacterium]